MKVFIVMRSAISQRIQVKLLLNDKITSTIEVKERRLYEAVVLDQVARGTLQLTASSSGLEVYTFTFG